jgi:uncharacterized protein (TIGR02001 family)
MLRKNVFRFCLIIILVMGLTLSATARDGIALNTSLDLYSRYIWRGMEIANTPSIQPTLSVSCGGFELGTWGAYSLSNNAFEADEVDFWLSYTQAFGNGLSITAMATDYYYPNAGIKFFNFNNSDATNPGAHTVEIGLSITGPESFPLTLSGYANVYNDAGANTYFQLDYPVTVDETDLNFFCGVAGGSRGNPDYYGAEKFAVINLGLSAVREINVSESFSLPLTVSLIANPKAETVHLIVGLSF